MLVAFDCLFLLLNPGILLGVIHSSVHRGIVEGEGGGARVRCPRTKGQSSKLDDQRALSISLMMKMMMTSPTHIVPVSVQPH